MFVQKTLEVQALRLASLHYMKKVYTKLSINNHLLKIILQLIERENIILKLRKWEKQDVARIFTIKENSSTQKHN